MTLFIGKTYQESYSVHKPHQQVVTMVLKEEIKELIKLGTYNPIRSIKRSLSQVSQVGSVMSSVETMSQYASAFAESVSWRNFQRYIYAASRRGELMKSIQVNGKLSGHVFKCCNA